MATTMGVVLAAQILLAALRPRGTVWFPRFVAMSTGLVGLAAIVWPDDIASPGGPWGAALIAWSVVFAAVAEVNSRGGRGRMRPRRPKDTRSMMLTD